MATIAHGPAGSALPAPSFLLRLYPAAWRARYGDEFAELLASRPPSLRDNLDILFGAFDARLHPQVGRGAPSEASTPHDRSIGALLFLAGILLTAWAWIGANYMPRWESGDIADEGLIAAASSSGLAGSILIAIALLVVASRYSWAIGESGSVGAVLTLAGLVFASLGGGVAALLLLGGGTALFAWRLRGRIVGTMPALLLVLSTAAVIGAFAAFGAGGGQDVRLLWGLLAYGPAWMVVGLAVRAPARPLVVA